ncbi:PhzF family phenazine biosynthesis protein [Altererythrobacter sp. BO-6]|uniref:PhzF family phenazine biosynthesis protein n=1 Tax=Altererythrobacter sp. BO-6 TaxID=2604537 RepID=UPI0019D2DE9B|nr:PhzF family phenazine biosynthesis protein [Altererythrobacter sp. BO-6]
MMRAPLLVDAFAGQNARGNRAAVILCPDLPEMAAMQARAAQLAEPATAFVCERPVNGTHRVRWFAPDREIALCGHGALAAGYVLLRQLRAAAVRLLSADGRELAIRRLDDGARYELALPAIPTAPREWPELIDALGAVPSGIRWNAAGYALAVFDDPAQVAGLKPDQAKLAQLGNLQLSVTAPGGSEADFTSRVFSSGREDAATGSAHAALAPYWYARLGRERLTANQASAAGGRFECRLERDLVWLGGECRLVT